MHTLKLNGFQLVFWERDGKSRWPPLAALLTDTVGTWVSPVQDQHRPHERFVTALADITQHFVATGLVLLILPDETGFRGMSAPCAVVSFCISSQVQECATFSRQPVYGAKVSETLVQGLASEECETRR